MPMSRKRIVLHVGLHKTGSTSIQTMCRKNDSRLRAVGVLYPGPDIDPRLKKGANHRAYYAALVGKKAKFGAMNGLKECRESLAQSVDVLRTDNGLHTMLLSHEALGRTSQSFDREIIGAWEKEFSLETVLYVRPLREWVESMYVQYIWSRSNHGGVVPTISKMFMDEIDAVRPSSVQDNLAAALPTSEIFLSSFVLRRQNDDLIENFLELTIPEAAPKLKVPKGEKRHKNITKLSCATMLLHQMIRNEVSGDNRQAIVSSLINLRREDENPPFADRNFYFVSDVDFARLEEIDRDEAQRFPDLALDAPVKRKADASFRLTTNEYAEMLAWLKQHIPAGAYEEAMNRNQGDA